MLKRIWEENDMEGWDGIGLVVKEYGKRWKIVIDLIIDMDRRKKRRVMVSMVKGEYWDEEIKSEKVDGMEDFKVYKRKVNKEV